MPLYFKRVKMRRNSTAIQLRQLIIQYKAT